MKYEVCKETCLVGGGAQIGLVGVQSVGGCQQPTHDRLVERRETEGARLLALLTVPRVLVSRRRQTTQHNTPTY